jgi:hypothetical protein
MVDAPPLRFVRVYYVEKDKIYIGIVNGKICDICKAYPRSKINPRAIIVEYLDATFEAVHHADGRLYLDGFALTDLMAWLRREMPNASWTAYVRRFYRMFPNSMLISDLVRAVYRCATGNEHQAHGDQSYYCAKVRNAWPAGLHPAVYFYSATGRHQPTSFLAIIELMMEMERDKSFNAFTDIRQKLEEFLLENKSFANQVTVKIGSGPKGYLPLKNLYKLIIDNLAGGKDSKEILALLAGTPAFRFLTPDDGITPTTSRRFSRETKSATFLKEALQGAIRCKICGGFLHFNSISIDHIIRKADGGLGVAENAQLSHPYCNSTYKN